MPALLTPFTSEGMIHRSTLRDLVEHFIALGIDGLYLCGSTGEGLLLSEAERSLVVEIALDAVDGRIPVIVHVGDSSTRAARSLTRQARDLGADGVASIPPFYYHFTAEEVAAFYRALKETAGDLPLYFYNIPDLINSRLDVDLARSLFEDGVIQGMKYTHHDMLTLQGIMEACGGKLNVFSGPDEKLLSFLVMGVDGGIGTTYNCMPELFLGVYRAFQAGDFERARTLQQQANRVISVMAQFNMIPALKAVMELQGWDVGPPRGPFLPLSAEDRDRLKGGLDRLGFFTLKADFDL